MHNLVDKHCHGSYTLVIEMKVTISKKNFTLLGSEKYLSIKNVSNISQSVYWTFHLPPKQFSTLLSCGAICNLDRHLLCSVSEWMEVSSLDSKKPHHEIEAHNFSMWRCAFDVVPRNVVMSPLEMRVFKFSHRANPKKFTDAIGNKTSPAVD